jgi:hypothetical protein
LKAPKIGVFRKLFQEAVDLLSMSSGRSKIPPPQRVWRGYPMRNLFSSRHTLIVAAGSLAAIVSIAAIAQAATDTIYKYTTPKPGVWHVSASAMTPEASNVAYQIALANGALKVTAGEGCFVEAVHLPNGATITSVAGTWDSDGTGSSGFALFRYAGSNSVPQHIVNEPVFLTNGRKVIRATASAAIAQVNNNQFSYVFIACLRSTADKFYAGKIAYTYTNAGD